MDRRTPVLAARVRKAVSLKQLPFTEDATPVYAYANHGRWVADCPCGGAELVVERAPLLCGSCGTTRPVVWPDNVKELETVLARRPKLNQNWHPGEPVDLLKAENLARGI